MFVRKHSRPHCSSSRKTLLNFIVLVVTCLVPVCVRAQEQRLSQYTHRSWLARDGFFNGGAFAIAQTTDGYIWVGTASGLYRSDGLRFELWTSPDGKKLPSNFIGALAAARDGSLWIGVQEGLAHFADGKLFVYPNFHDDVAALLEDRSGGIWFTRIHDGGVLKTPICQALPETIRCFDESDGLATKVCCAISLIQDTEGYLWTTTEGPVLRWKPGHSETYLPEAWARLKGLQSNSMVGMPDGSVLVGVSHPGAFGGLQRLSMGHWTPVKVPGFDGSKVSATSVFRDKDGGIWLGTSEGIYRIHGNTFDKFSIQDGLSADEVLGFYEDREGGIWAATEGGVDYFHPRNVTTFSKRDGLGSDHVDAITATHDNAVWVNTDEALDVLKNGRVDAIHIGHRWSQPTAIFVDSFDRLWSGIDNDLYLYDHGKFEKVRRKNGGSTRFIVGIAEDSAHDIWAEISGESHELIRVHGLEVVEEYPESVIPSARAMAAGPDGVLWLGLRSGDLARFSRGHAEVFPSPGGPKSYVYQVVVNADGSVLAPTSAGLIAWKDGTSRLLSSKNGMPCDLVSGVAWDNQNALWLHTGCGLARISEEDMSRWWRDDTAHVTPMMLDGSDGVMAAEPATFNVMATTKDGRIWFATKSSVQVVDPNHLTQNKILPPVHIEQVVADRQLYRPNDKLTFPPLMRDLEIDYSALSFVNPQKVRFRYKLEQRDEAWQDVGVRRQAFYTNLRPGSYRFRVIASNDDGLWNEEGASFAFTIPPAWYQTTAFGISCLIGLAFLLWLVYYLRMKQASRSLRARLDERVAERTRLARDLHDTLLQTLQGSKLVADDALEHRSDPEYTHRSLERLTEWIDRAMREGRAALDALHVGTPDDRELSKRLQSVLDEHELSSVSERVVTISGTPVEIDPIILDEICRVGYEAIRNALMHSCASRIEVQLAYSDDFTLIVRDNGRGMDSTVASKGRDGHYGLQSMRERAARIQAQLQLITAPNLGTTIELKLPKKIAFGRPSSAWAKLRSWSGRPRRFEV